MASACGSGAFSEPLLAILGRPCGLCGLGPLFGSMSRSCTALGAFRNVLVLLWGPLLAGLGHSRGLCWCSCTALRNIVGGLGSLLGSLWPVLGCLGACFVELSRCSRPWICFDELIRCSRSSVCFVELIRRFPFSAAQVSRRFSRRGRASARLIFIDVP